MENNVVEAQYPIDFRQDDANILGKQIKARQSVILIGMKRVGISNFLRFFIHHEESQRTYVDKSMKHLFVSIDLNDLVELDIQSFWILTFKRIIDSLERSKLSLDIKKKIKKLFAESVKSYDSFIVIDGVRKSLIIIIESGILPTLFFIRFDRIKDFVSSEFFANLQGLRDATNHKLCYVFTSFRRLDVLFPNLLAGNSSSAFFRNVFIKPAKKEDTKIIFEMYFKNEKTNMFVELEKDLFNAVDGYVQYLQLALIALAENKPLVRKEGVFDFLSKDERITLASDELWESLNDSERTVLEKIARGKSTLNEEKEKNKYLWDTGFVFEETRKTKIFSPIFEHFIKQRKRNLSNNSVTEFTKKENLLFNFLRANKDMICEREKIVEGVWPEVEELGVSDWAIDRLVARLRVKLISQKARYEIQTVKTRGYKMIAN